MQLATTTILLLFMLLLNILPIQQQVIIRERLEPFAETPLNAIRFKLSEIATKFDYIMNVDINAINCYEILLSGISNHSICCLPLSYYLRNSFG